MALVVKPQREPFSRPAGPAYGDGEKADIIRGVAYQRLRSALEKYLRKRSSGRSFVISGNRGIGKSTMVLAVVEDLLIDSEKERRERAPIETAPRSSRREVEPGAHTLCRPLLVILSGPDVIREELRPLPPPKAGEAPQPQAQVKSSDNLLRQIARALHVSLAREFALRYELTVAGQGARAELIEAWAQLGLELGAGVKIQALRRFWDLPGRLESGVLFTQPMEPDRQGFCELIALEASAAAYRIAIGKVSENDDLTLQAQTESADLSWGEQLKSLAAPATGLIGGAITGLGVHQLTAGTPATTWASLGAALVSGLTLTFGLAPKRTVTGQSVSKFSPDTDIGSLTWRLSGVVDRLFRAGIAPVFVIDELDKVAPHPQGLDWLSLQAQELKCLLTERAFFCFLTGREFAERLHVERTERKYPPSYTMFSEYLFVNYLPQELHEHVRERFEPKDSPSAHVEEEREALVAAILPFVVLFRAEMHPIDVRRELNALLVGEDKLQLFTGYNLPPADGVALLFQIAIESVLAADEVERRVRKDARFALLAIDAVYYAPRSWRVGGTLDKSDQAITNYLNLRRGPDEARPGEPPASQELEPLPPGDLRLLLGCAQKVIELVRKHKDIVSIVEQDWFLERLGPASSERDRKRSLIQAALPRIDDLLEQEGTSDTLLRWRYDTDGLLILSDVDMAQVRGDVRRFFTLQKRVDEPLSQKGKFEFGLEAIEGEFGIFQHTMKWRSALAIAEGLKGASGFGASAIQERTNAKALHDYLDVVEAGLPRLVWGVLLCQVLGPGKALKRTLPILATALELQRLADDARAARLSTAWLDYLNAFKGAVGPDVTLFFKDFSPQEFAKKLNDLVASVESYPRPTPAEVEPKFWSNWGERIEAGLRGSTTRPQPGWADVAWHLERDGKPMLLSAAFERNSASAWTEILLAAHANAPASDEAHYPRSLGAAAAASLRAWSLAATLSSSGSSLLPFLQRQSEEPARRLIVIVANERNDAGALRWAVSERLIGLVVGRNRLKWLEALVEPLGASRSLRVEDTWLFVEADAHDVPVPPETLLESNPGLSVWPPTRRAQLFAEAPKVAGYLDRARGVLRSMPRVVVGANSIDDAVQKADALPSPAP